MLRRLQLPAILILATALRLWGLPNQPVLYFDSGQYLGEARYLASAVRAATHSLLEPDPAAPANPLARMVQAAATGTQAHPPDNAKVGHSLLLATSMLVLGDSTFAAALVSALAGIAAVAITYALGALGWGRRVAVVGALLLAISGEHLTYSREPYAEADTLLFAALGFLIYLQAISRGGTWRSLLAVGSLFGLAFACNTRASYLPLVLVPTELAAWQARGWACWRPTAVRAVAGGIGFGLPLALIEAGYLLARLLGRWFDAPTAFPDYVQQVAAYWQQHSVTIRFDQWPTGLVDLALLDGLPVVLLMLVGIVWTLLRPKRRPDLLLLSALVLPLVLYSVYVAGVARMRPFSLALPWVMLAAALGLDALTRGLEHLVRLASGRAALLSGAATAVLLLSATPRVADLVTAPNAMPDLLDYLATAGLHDVASTDGAVLSFWLGEDHTNAKFRAAYINSADDLEALANHYRVLAVDMQGYLFPNELAQRYAQAQPLFAAPHGSGMWYLASMLEHRGVSWGEWDRLLADWERYRAAATQLRVEDLHVLAEPTVAAPHEWAATSR